jgi:hypothetical protein
LLENGKEILDMFSEEKVYGKMFETELKKEEGSVENTQTCLS